MDMTLTLYCSTNYAVLQQSLAYSLMHLSLTCLQFLPWSAYLFPLLKLWALATANMSIYNKGPENVVEQAS
jgi:hypothetical protein